MGLTLPETPSSDATLPSRATPKEQPAAFAGRYVIERELGRGGMGIVLLARDEKLSRRVAIKVLPRGAGADELQRFEQEARAAGALNHPNVVAVHDIGMEDGQPYIVSEFLEGGTLRERLGGRPLTVRQSVDYAVQLARGLSAAHEHGIIHRDLKPENLFISNEGRLKILDFGIAKLPRQAGAPHTQTGAVMGTVGYMSPEQVRGEPSDARSDVFSFGAIFYEMLAGRPAFDRKTPVESCYAIVHQEQTELPDLVPLEVERVVRRCLEKKPEQRYQTAHELALDVQALAGTTGSRPALSGRLSWRSLALTAAIGLVAGGAIGVLAWTSLRAPSQPRFEKITFRTGRIFEARFGPGGSSVIYSAAWEGGRPEPYITTVGSPEARSLGLPSGYLLSVSSKGELLLQLRPRFNQRREVGTLARVAMQGAAPREIADDVAVADWGPDGESIAAVREEGGQSRIEFPLGHVLLTRGHYIGHLRVSPDGGHIAFTHGRAVEIADVKNGTTVSAGPLVADVVVWRSPTELWVSGRKEAATVLSSVSLGGTVRAIASLPGYQEIADLAGDHVLLSSHLTRLHVAVSTRGGKETELAPFDESLLRDLAQDGSAVLVWDMHGKGSHLRRTDGSPALHLTTWNAFSFSPDGRRILAAPDDGPLTEVPVGPGDPFRLAPDGLVVDDARYFPGGERILLTAHKGGESPRFYVRDRLGSEPRAISPEGMLSWRAISPDGQWIAGVQSDLRTRLYPIAGGDPRAIPGLAEGFVPAGFTAGGRQLVVFGVGELPARMLRVALDTGKIEPWRTLAPADAAGLKGIFGVWMTPDGSSYAYGYRRTLSELLLADGLR